MKQTPTFENATRSAVFYLVALAGILLVSLNLPFETHVESAYFFMFHSILETAGIIIAAMIFIAGWAPLQEHRTAQSSVLSGAFLSVGIIELGHMVTFDGHFAQSFVFSDALSTLLTLCAQAFAAIGLLSFAFFPARIISKRAANLIYFIFALFSFAIIFFAFIAADLGAKVVTTETGLNSGYILYEIVIGIIFVIVGVKEFPYKDSTKNFPSLTVSIAAFVLAMSAIYFANHFHVNELNSLIGHIYKLAAYILLFRALVLKNIEQPYYEILDLQQRFQSALEAMPDLVFETSVEGLIFDYHSTPAKDKLTAKPAQFLGHNVSEFLPEDAARAVQLALRECEETGHSYGQQYTLMHADGERRYEISASVVNYSNNEQRYLLLVRDISITYALTQRLKALLGLSKASENLTEHELAQLGLDTLEKLTKSKVSFLHFLSTDEREIELFAWGSETEALYCKAEQELHYPLESAGIWADCVRKRKAVIINDYANEPTKKGLPDGHSVLTRFVSVPIFEGSRIGLIIGIGNADYMYSDATVNTVELFGTELYQILQRRRAQNESDKNRLLLTSALENLPVGVAITTRGNTAKFEYSNQQFPAIFGISSNHLSDFPSFWEAAIEDETIRQKVLGKMQEAIPSEDLNRFNWERIAIQKAGTSRRSLTVQVVRVADTELNITIVEDVTDAQLKEEEIRIAATAFSSQEGILITDTELKILRVNKAFEQSSGYSAEELIGQTPAFLQSGHQDPAFYRKMWKIINEFGVWRGEILNKSKDGRVTPYSLTISAVKNTLGTVTHFVADYIDLSDIKAAQTTISRLSYFDTLTGLPNREHLKSVLTDQHLMRHSSKEFIGAIMIDLDNFKTINETLGHEYGDILLLQVAKRLQSLLRPNDIVARYGGDEFVILATELGEDTQQAALKTQLISQSAINALEGTYILGNKSYYSSASIGAAMFPISKLDFQEVFKQLDIALSSAKRDGDHQIRFFDPAWQESVNNRVRLLNELRVAIKEHQLELFYQAQQNDQGQIVGTEGLIRWNHPTRGLLPPSDFLPIAQESHLMVKLGDEVMRMGLKQLHAWQKDSAFALLKLSINITADQFYEERFEQGLLKLLEKYAITPGSLMLEFTESMMLGDVATAREKILRLNASDVEFAIDDFGTGYSSLSYLSSLPMDQLKIDQSFVRNIGLIESESQIVKTIINMAHTLQMGVIAEGVETQEQLDFLTEQGCEMFQGYLFSKPLPIKEFNDLVRKSPRPKA